MYEFTTTERNNNKANEYETKAMLYLFGCRKDSINIDVFIIDCFNDVTGSTVSVDQLWDVQSKGVQSLNPQKIGTALITLYQNYISDIDFEYYILLMPKLKEMYLQDEELSAYGITNFIAKYVDKIREGLSKEYLRRNKISPDAKDIEDFLNKIEFIIANGNKAEYVKKITTFTSKNSLEDEFYNIIFDEIRDKQTILKSTNIDGYTIMKPAEVLQFGKSIWKKDIDSLVINRMLGVDIFNQRAVPIAFIDEIVTLESEERKDVLVDCQSEIAKMLFDKNGRMIFWKFFEKLLSHKKDIIRKTPREILQQIKSEKILIPRILSDMSVIYMISLLKEGLKYDN